MLFDVSFAPRISANDTTGSIKAIHRWLIAFIDSINKCLSNIDGGNMSDDFVDTLTATKVIAQTVISTTVITENLYSTFGDVVALTVDRLVTENKVTRYQDRDASDMNYVWIQEQSVKLVTATTDGSMEQHKDGDGKALYWKDSKQEAMGQKPTSFPVTVYAYAELVNAEFSFVMDEESGNYMPKITLGTGDPSGNDKLYIYKPANKAVLEYFTPNGTTRTAVEFSDFVDAKLRRLDRCTIDKTKGKVTVYAEGQSTPDVLDYTETDNSMTFTWPDGFVTEVTIA